MQVMAQIDLRSVHCVALIWCPPGRIFRVYHFPAWAAPLTAQSSLPIFLGCALILDHWTFPKLCYLRNPLLYWVWFLHSVQLDKPTFCKVGRHPLSGLTSCLNFCTQRYEVTLKKTNPRTTSPYAMSLSVVKPQSLWWKEMSSSGVPCAQTQRPFLVFSKHPLPSQSTCIGQTEIQRLIEGPLLILSSSWSQPPKSSSEGPDRHPCGHTCLCRQGHPPGAHKGQLRQRPRSQLIHKGPWPDTSEDIKKEAIGRSLRKWEMGETDYPRGLESAQNMTVDPTPSQPICLSHLQPNHQRGLMTMSPHTHLTAKSSLLSWPPHLAI